MKRELKIISTALPAGTPAPEVALKSTPDQIVKLSEFRGRSVVLVFYPADWSPVCGDQIGLYNEMASEFQEFDAEILGISVDGPWCHAAFSRDRKLHFPLLSDFEPKGEVARLYGVYAWLSGAPIQVSQGDLIVKRLNVHGFWMYYEEYLPKIRAALIEATNVVASGKLILPFTEIYKPSQIKEAVEHAERGGKILLDFNHAN